MAQNENYSVVDLRIGTEEQFNAKVGTLPAGTLFGITDSTVSKADLSTDLKNEINGKINKPANPTSDSAVVINSSGAIGTKPLTSITGKAEVAVSSTTPLNDEILWINPDGTSGGGGSSGGGKLYQHTCTININNKFLTLIFFDYQSTEHTIETASASPRIGYQLSAVMDSKKYFGVIDGFTESGYVQFAFIAYANAMSYSGLSTYEVTTFYGQQIASLSDTVTEL